MYFEFWFSPLQMSVPMRGYIGWTVVGCQMSLVIHSSQKNITLEEELYLINTVSSAI